MRGEVKLSIARPVILYAIFWIMFVMFMNQLGIWNEEALGISVPPISVPTVSQESPKVVTQDFMKVTGYNVERDRVSFYIYAGTVEQNVIIVFSVDGYPIQSFALPPYQEFIQPVNIRLESGSHELKVMKIKDENVILDDITWTVNIP